MAADSPILGDEQRPADVGFVVPDSHVPFKLKQYIFCIYQIQIKFILKFLYHNGLAPKDEVCVRRNDGRRRVKSVNDSLDKRFDRCHSLHQDALAQRRA